jgi:nitrogen-specific signal transduction histidine kinase
MAHTISAWVHHPRDTWSDLRRNRDRGVTVTEEQSQDEIVRQRVQAMKDDELVDFIRDTVARLNGLADRLEVYADTEKESDDSAGTSTA